MSSYNTEMYRIFFHTLSLTFVTTLLKRLGLAVAQPRSVVQIKAAVALEEEGKYRYQRH